MNPTTIIKNVAITAAGVVVAGFLMATFKDMPIISTARNGFDV